jgi:hypothetical protein
MGEMLGLKRKKSSAGRCHPVNFRVLIGQKEAQQRA